MMKELVGTTGIPFEADRLIQNLDNSLHRCAHILVMDLDSIRNHCLSLPHATEDIQWGNDLLFRISGKIFTGISLDPPHSLSFKCTPEKFDELIELDGIVPAPYTARNKWVMFVRLDALNAPEIRRLIKNSYEIDLC